MPLLKASPQPFEKITQILIIFTPKRKKANKHISFVLGLNTWWQLICKTLELKEGVLSFSH